MRRIQRRFEEEEEEDLRMREISGFEKLGI